MKFAKVSCLLFVFAGAAAPAMAAGCSGKVDGKSVCVAATKLAKLLSSQMPVTEGQVTLEKATARKNTVEIKGRFELDQATAQQFLDKNRLTIAQFEDTYSAKMVPNLCGAGSPTRAFIDGGGAIVYAYTYKNGRPFLKFGVRTCASAPAQVPRR